MDTHPAPLAALIQMTSGIDPAANLQTIDRAMGEAAAGGAAMATSADRGAVRDVESVERALRERG